MSVFGRFARALASPQSGWHLIAGSLIQSFGTGPVPG